MAADNVACSGSGDAYARMVEQQRQYAQDYENYVRGTLVPKDKAAEEQEYTSYTNMKYATGVFDAASSDKLTLQQQLEHLQAEMNARISQAREEAQKAGKTDDEIAQICANISAQYTGRIQNLQFNIARAGRTALLKQNTLAEARNIYQNDRYTSIATSNDVYSGFLTASANWLEAGRMQQNLNFTEGQSRSGGFEAIG